MNKSSAKYGVFGDPVSHSLSPLMHLAAFQALGVNASYEAYTVSDAERCMEIIRKLDIIGASVTMPLKEKVLKYCDHVDRHAEVVGAVNTLVISGNKISGYNTDWIGVREAVGSRKNVKGNVVVVVGAGGAARAAVYAVIQNGGIPVVVSRRKEQGEAVARHFGCQYCPLGEIGDLKADGMINATPVGMTPFTSHMVVEREVLARFNWVMDMVYKPIETKLLREASALGIETIDGVSMFVHQGAEQFRMWTGMNPPLKVMEQVVRLALNDLASSCGEKI
ncbi:MAG: shikimate dehydrogenase [Syntrophales bacterium]|nr:shikimate dehydrogenase [Syntrophales bacterium]